jgi:hypothetical protein
MTYQPRTASHPAILVITEADRDLVAAERALHDAVDAARADGHSWATIGDALNVTRQAAQQRFSTRL